MYSVGRAYLVGGHRERVNIARFRGVAIPEAKLRWAEQFWSRVADTIVHRVRKGIRLHDIGYGADDPKVPQLCDTIFRDQNISLDRKDFGACHELGTRSPLTGCISPCTILSECRYSRPQTACASYEDKSQIVFYEDCGNRLQAVTD